MTGKNKEYTIIHYTSKIQNGREVLKNEREDSYRWGGFQNVATYIVIKKEEDKGGCRREEKIGWRAF